MPPVKKDIPAGAFHNKRVLLKDGRKVLLIGETAERGLVTADSDRPAPVESVPRDYYTEII